MSNDNVLTLQIENSIYKLQYKNPNQNNLLIKKIYNEKIYFNKGLADLLAASGNGEQSILIAAFYMGTQYHLKSILRAI